ncbi:MAG: hypothetical protein K2N87_10065 [Eubacterium sp.]|nr:hypothetical protein [Eubacterium sp.]
MDLHKNRENSKMAMIWCILISSGIVFLLYRLWEFDFNVPLNYSDGDSLLSLETIKRSKSLKEFFLSTNLGAPFIGSNFDYPSFGDVFNLLYFKIFAEIFGVVLGLNIGYFLLFPITSVISFLVMKQFYISNLWAVLGSVTFSFLPYRLLRNTMHLFLSCYFLIPVAILLCFWLIQDENFFKIDKEFLKYKRNLIGIFCFMLIAYTGIYYAFFTAFFVCISVIYKTVSSKKIAPVKNGLLACASICIPLIISSIPYVLFRLYYGANIEKPTRSPIEAEVYGMKLTQLFIPIKDYGIQFLKSLKESYASAPVPNEGSEYLGIVGIIGFIILVFCLFITERKWKVIDHNIIILSRLNGFAILLGTIGGFGSLFALLISPQIRGYNRISVFIAYFSILSICILLTNLSSRLIMISMVPVILIFIISIADQTNIENFQTSREETITSFYSDQKFISDIEQLVSEDAMIYQWVYQPYPENPPIHQMGDYASIRGYLHSDHLRWSYGDQKGRNSDLWNRDLASKSIQERIHIICNVGFEGIYIDSYAYSEDELSELLDEMKSILGVNPFVSEDGRLVFFELKPYVQEYRKNYSDAEWETMQNENLTMIQFINGFYGIEMNEKNGFSWRWCSQKGTLRVIKSVEKQGEIHMKVYSGTEEESKIIVTYGDEKVEYTITHKGKEISVPLEQKITDIYINNINGKKVEAPNDPRELYMRFGEVCVEYER